MTSQVTANAGRQRAGSLVAATAMAAAAGLLLAACGGGSVTATKADTKTQAAELTTLLGVDPAAKLGQGKTWKLGAALPMSGPGAPQGKEIKQAIELAAGQIKAAGGPSIELIVKDIKGPDPVASKQAAQELAAAKVPAKISSYGDGLGVMLASTAKDKILSLDGVGGAQPFAQGVPYFYGTRAVAPGDALAGALMWLKKAQPKAKTVGLVGWDLGPFNAAIKADTAAKIAAAGLTFNGLWETTSPASQDFASVLTKVKAKQPDMLLIGMGAQAPGAFAAQAKAAGVKSLLMGIEFTPTAAAASKGVFDTDGFHFAMDYFDASHPTNPLGAMFAKTYQKRYGSTPTFYGANAYEETLAFWDLIRRVIDKGGDINDSSQLLAALEAKPTVASVYGGDKTTVGELSFDPKTHGVASRPMGVYEYKAGKVTTLATYGVNGAGFALH